MNHNLPRRPATARLLLAFAATLGVASLAPSASAAEFVDKGNDGEKYTDRANNMAIWAAPDAGSDGVFQVQYREYAAETPDDVDDPSLGTFSYDAVNPVLNTDASKQFSGIELETITWSGRAEHDKESPADVYEVRTSDDGDTFSEPLTLDVSEGEPAGDNVRHTLSADGFSARFVQVTVHARPAGQGHPANDSWSASVDTVTLRSGGPAAPAEPN